MLVLGEADGGAAEGAHRAPRLLLLLLLPPAPAEPPDAAFLGEHLSLQRASHRRRASVAGGARRGREPEASRAVAPAGRNAEV